MSRPATPSRGRAWLLAGSVAAVAIVCDQVAKAAVRSGLEPGERVDLVFGFDLVRLTNSGIAFGLFDDGGPVVLVVAAAALVAVIAWFALAPDRPGLWLAVGLLAGGAIGNLIDRIHDSAVTDFLDPPLWPAFNVADVAITLGAFTLALVVLRAPSEDDGADGTGGSP